MHKQPVVVVIDDNRLWVWAVREALEAEGFEVHVAYDVPHGVKLLSIMQPQLVILDWHLPRICGRHVLEEFRHSDAGTPVLVVSADDRPSVRDLAIAQGATAFLDKPLSALAMCEAVRDMLEPLQTHPDRWEV